MVRGCGTLGCISPELPRPASNFLPLPDTAKGSKVVGFPTRPDVHILPMGIRLALSEAFLLTAMAESESSF